jgi:hypothetical protein
MLGRQCYCIPAYIRLARILGRKCYCIPAYIRLARMLGRQCYCIPAYIRLARSLPLTVLCTCRCKGSKNPYACIHIFQISRTATARDKSGKHKTTNSVLLTFPSPTVVVVIVQQPVYMHQLASSI